MQTPVGKNETMFLENHQIPLFLCNLDIDECTEQPGICGPQGNCRNTPREYVCECGDGYVTDPNGEKCDITFS